MSESGRGIAIVVPGPWTGLEQLGAALARRKSGLTLAGNRLMDRRTALASLELAAEGPHQAAFCRANADSCLTEMDMLQLAGRRPALLAKHSRSSFEAANQLLRAGAVLLDVGGLAVMAESAGLAHSAAHWHELAARHDPADLYRAFVRLALEPEGGHSCGMHYFGLPDAWARDTGGLRSDGAAGAISRLLDSFNAYQLLETPDLADGHLFSPDEWSPWFGVRWQSDPFHAPDDAHHNPFGIWELVPEPS
jgi:hypothetical protein